MEDFGPLLETMCPRLVAVERFHDLRSDGVLLRIRESFHATQRFLQQASHGFSITQDTARKGRLFP